VLEALWWGAFGSSSLVIGAVFALRVTVDRLVLGLVMGFGAGVLLSAVAFELVEEAFDTSGVLTDVGVVTSLGFATAFAIGAFE
jgi:zinc transporter, ZIP family